MEMQPRRVRRQTERPLVADEMHLVPPPRQFLPQRRGQDAAAADRGITSDADFHVPRMDRCTITHPRPRTPSRSEERAGRGALILFFLIRVYPCSSGSKSPRTAAHLRQRVEDERIVGKQGDGMADAGAQPAQPRARELQFNITAGGTCETCASIAAVQAARISGAETSISTGVMPDGSASGVTA